MMLLVHTFKIIDNFTWQRGHNYCIRVSILKINLQNQHDAGQIIKLKVIF